MENPSRILIVGSTEARADETADLLAAGILTKHGVRVRSALHLEAVDDGLYGVIRTPAAEHDSLGRIGREAALKCTLLTVREDRLPGVIAALRRLRVEVSSVLTVFNPL